MMSRKFRWPIRLLAAVGLVAPLALVASPAGADVIGSTGNINIYTPSSCAYSPILDLPPGPDPVLPTPNAPRSKIGLDGPGEGASSILGEYWTCVDAGWGVLRGELTAFNPMWPGRYAQGPVVGRWHLELVFAGQNCNNPNPLHLANSAEYLNPAWNLQMDTAWAAPAWIPVSYTHLTLPTNREV